MQFRLIRTDGVAGELVSSADLPDDFSAADWARSWLMQEAQHDRYWLQRDDGSVSHMMIRTIGGQWYFLRQTMPK